MDGVLSLATDAVALAATSTGWLLLTWGPLIVVLGLAVQTPRPLTWITALIIVVCAISVALLGLIAKWLGQGVFQRAKWRTTLLAIASLLYSGVYGVTAAASFSGKDSLGQVAASGAFALLFFSCAIILAVSLAGERKDVRVKVSIEDVQA